MIKLRIEGNQEEIQPLLDRWQQMGIPTPDISKTLKVKSVSKFYPNRVNSTDLLNGVADTSQGRVYLEVE